jgi:hypothetical protein
MATLLHNFNKSLDSLMNGGSAGVYMPNGDEVKIEKMVEDKYSQTADFLSGKGK